MQRDAERGRAGKGRGCDSRLPKCTEHAGKLQRCSGLGAAGLKIQFWRVRKPQRGAGRDVTQKPAREATPLFCGWEVTSCSSSPGLAGLGFAPATASGRDVKSRGSRRRRRRDHVSSRAPGVYFPESEAQRCWGGACPGSRLKRDLASRPSSVLADKT